MARRDDHGINLAEPMEFDNVHMLQPSREDCRRKNMCFRCKKPGHRMNDCHVKSFRGRRNDGPHRVVNSVQIRTPSLDESKNDESMSFCSYTMNMSFDGHIRRNMRLRAVHATLEMDGMKFDSVALTEYRLPVTQDLILGKPWLTGFNPVID
ncbi:hypothetical protein PsorP6_012806 [Peronosclerospora sorghi]|uniref:Uncharacterized protein n=1 Tax=Peronosclerospora sorghi TaxID=230839 RepID=A0ACC0WH09_9STRA|nr:hypothetical protein PsorP6_012806 [Peronosclerospora sorghi]